MLSLFTSFDYFIYFFNPCFILFTLCFFFMTFFFYSFNSYIMLVLINYFIEFFSSLGYSFYKFKSFFMLYLIIFVVIFFMNYVSVFSFNFAFTSHISNVLFFSFVIWFLSFSFNMMKNLNGFLSHLVPVGTPMYLVFFMVVVEFISMIIRPITLMVRLVSNILSGHLLMILLSNLVFFNYYAFLFYVLLNLVELFVSFIQSYIFSTLLVLYLSDVV